MSSDTPRTDAFTADGYADAGEWRDFARQLERENARLRAALAPFAERGAEGYSFSSDVYETARAALKDANG